jgi:hypothetical protein
MAVKIAAALIAIALLGAYLLPLAWKLKDVSLWAVIAIGLVMMLVDLIQSLRNGNG